MKYVNSWVPNKISFSALTSIVSIVAAIFSIPNARANEIASLPQLIGASALHRVAIVDTQLHLNSIQTALSDSILTSSVIRGGGGISLTNPLGVHLRVGAMVSPRTKFIGGLDVTIPGLGFGTNYSTRVDADAIVSANIGGVSTLIPLTINEVYSKGLITGTRFYGGAGVGAYIGKVTRLGGKIFVGVDLAGRISGELGVHFSGFGDPLLTLQARLPL